MFQHYDHQFRLGEQSQQLSGDKGISLLEKKSAMSTCEPTPLTCLDNFSIAKKHILESN